MLDLDEQALEAYSAGEIARARAMLLKAVAAGKKAGLDDDPAMARVYLDLGAVNLADNDRGEALRNFGLALSIKPDIEPSADIASPALKKVVAVARLQVKRGRGAAAAAVAARKKGKETKEVASSDDVVATGKPKPATRSQPPPVADDGEGRATVREPAPVREHKESVPVAKVSAPSRPAQDEEPELPADPSHPLYCPSPDEAPPAADVPLRCVATRGLAVSSMVLFYRPAGSETFISVPMVRSSKGWYRGVVPASALVGKTLQYYVEAHGPASTVAGSNGEASSPNLVIIRPGAAPVSLRAVAAAPSARSESSASVEENPLTAAEEKRVDAETSLHRRRTHALWIGVGLGSGMGWHPARTLEFRREDNVASGFSPAALMQLTPEIGWQYDESWAFSLQTRHQFIPESGSGDDRLGAPAHGALAVLLRAYRYFGQSRGQPFVSAAIGYGDAFRLVIPPHPEMGVIRNDTVKGGPWVLGPGAGYLYNFTSHFGWAAEARLLGALPDRAALVEFMTGGQVGF
jgi:tetratricopeptide (TPR) repeat protein